MPPTIRRLRYSSVAMRSLSGMSSALEWVRNGRADAPPAIVSSVGVSTSKKPRASMKRRISATMRDRAIITSRTCGLTIRSTYRRR